MKFRSYGKINLFLKIMPKEDKKNLHDIYSFFHLYKKIYDYVFIKKSKKDSITYFRDNEMVDIKNCIINKTLKFLRENYNIRNNYSIIIIKKIPLGSGLGGGSSNASILIKYIFKKENIDVSNYNCFYKIGSDIPFFLSSWENALVTNYGKDVVKMKNPKVFFKLKINNIICDTSVVYDKFDKIKNNNKKNPKKQLEYLYSGKYSLLENDLQFPCFLIYPLLKDIYNNLNKTSIVKLSGSGSTFILYKKEKVW
ncbi:MAG: hypothetical protein ACRDCG_00730 [Mycoplasmoidaceae bacterium]